MWPARAVSVVGCVVGLCGATRCRVRFAGCRGVVGLPGGVALCGAGVGAGCVACWPAACVWVAVGLPRYRGDLRVGPRRAVVPGCGQPCGHWWGHLCSHYWHHGCAHKPPGRHTRPRPAPADPRDSGCGPCGHTAVGTGPAGGRQSQPAPPLAHTTVAAKARPQQQRCGPRRRQCARSPAEPPAGEAGDSSPQGLPPSHHPRAHRRTHTTTGGENGARRVGGEVGWGLVAGFRVGWGFVFVQVGGVVLRFWGGVGSIVGVWTWVWTVVWHCWWLVVWLTGCLV